MNQSLNFILTQHWILSLSRCPIRKFSGRHSSLSFLLLSNPGRGLSNLKSALGPATFPSTRRATPKAEQTGDRPTLEVIGKDTVISILERQFSWRSCNHSIHRKNKFRLKFESCHFWSHSGNHRVRKAASQFSSPAQKCSVTWPSALVPSFFCPRRIVPTTGEKRKSNKKGIGKENWHFQRGCS